MLHSIEASNPILVRPTVGQMIAAYRRRRRQTHRDATWSQEDLAFASATSQAHISRIESNRQLPEYATLIRICQAFELSPAERSYLLALAGFEVAAPLPTELELNRIVPRLRPIIDSMAYPATLIDESERMWYLNALAAQLWGECYGSTQHEDCLAIVRGHRTVELQLAPDLDATCLAGWAAYDDDFENGLMRSIALLWRAWSLRPHEADLNRAVAWLARNPAFLTRWQQLAADGSHLIFLEHDTKRIRHPLFGPLRFHCWRTRAAFDERFIVVHFTPIDSATRRVLADLSALRSPVLNATDGRHPADGEAAGTFRCGAPTADEALRLPDQPGSD